MSTCKTGYFIPQANRADIKVRLVSWPLNSGNSMQISQQAPDDLNYKRFVVTPMLPRPTAPPRSYDTPANLPLFRKCKLPALQMHAARQKAKQALQVDRSCVLAADGRRFVPHQNVGTVLSLSMNKYSNFLYFILLQVLEKGFDQALWLTCEGFFSCLRGTLLHKQPVLPRQTPSL